MLHEASHQWVNKQMGIKVPDYPFLKEGKEGHRIVQDHVSGKKKHKYLKHIKVKFPIVEEESDEADSKKYWKGKEECKFSFPVKTDKGGFEITGYYDGREEDYSKILEAKFSSTPWSLGKFRKSMQRKLYGLSNFKIKEAVLITGTRPKITYKDKSGSKSVAFSVNVDDWERNKPKLYSIPYTSDDYKDATDWIFDGINILLKGDFTGGLDEDGKCTGCFYGQNCNFL